MATASVLVTLPNGSLVPKEHVDKLLKQYWSHVVTASASLALKFRPLKATLWDLEGNICAGKTSAGPRLVETLKEAGYDAVFFSERMNTELLEQFYSDPAKYSYMLQVYAASQCNTSHVKATNATSKEHKVSFVDRGGWGMSLIPII